MQNHLIKNNKTWLLGDIQHRTSHYNRILCAKSTYTDSQPRKFSLVDHLNCKYRTNTQADKREKNRKLVNSLLQIDKKQSEYCKQQYRQPKSLKNEFVLKQQNNKIMDQNIQLYRKIVNASSAIGSKKRWRSRKKQLQNLSKILNKKRQNFLDLDKKFYNTFQKLRNRRSPESIIKVQPKLGDSFRKQNFRTKKRQKFLTEPIQINDNQQQN